MTLDRVHIWKYLEASTWVTLAEALVVSVFKSLSHPFFFFFFLTEPLADVTKGLINSAAVAGEEFSISVELSAVCSGFWSLNGRLLRSGADYLITRSKNTHTLLIRCVTAEMDGTEVKFVGGGSQSSCTLSVKGMCPNSYSDGCFWFPIHFYLQ